MRALLVFESMFGNTEGIARAVADGLSVHLPVDIVEVGSARVRFDGDVSLLVVGGPTHAHGMSRSGTRQNPRPGKRPPRSDYSPEIGVRELLEKLDPARGEVDVATFDTRFAKPRWLTGSAAASAMKRLRELGYRMACEPASFFVTDAGGPLVAGELERAREWGEHLGAEVASTGPRIRAS